MKVSSHTQSIFLFLLGKELMPYPGRHPLPSLCSILTLCGSGGVTQSVVFHIDNEQFMEETAAQTEMVTTLLAEWLGSDTPCGWLLRG